MICFRKHVYSERVPHVYRFAAIAIFLCLSTTAAFTSEPSTAEEKYFVHYISVLNDTQERLVLMNKDGYLAKLGQEGIPGLISGTLSYKTSIKGLSGIITLIYDNFCDEEGWVFDGEIIVKSNMVANGNFDGKITVSGANAGIVYYDKVIMKSGKAGGGTYGVELPGKKRAEVDYTWFFEAE